MGPAVEPDALALPALRQDLRLIDGGAEGAGPGRWRIHDPLAQRFFELEQDAVDLLALWDAGTVGALRTAARERLGREVAADTVMSLLSFLDRHELLQSRPGHSYARARQQQQAAARHPWWQRLLHGYLYIRVPLLQPDRFLRSTLPWVRPLFSPVFWALMALLGLLGAYLVSRQWESFIGTLPQLFNVAGAVSFTASLVLVKSLHELGHGYASARLGSRVTSMGVAFIVMVPVAYTDTTDAWRLRRRRERVMVDAAGMAVELAVAVLATLAWVFLPDGALRHCAFALATTGWVLSLAVNLNPLMRFDGYYLFSDLIGVANLQERSFAFGRWWLRELLFGYGDAPPEAAAPARQRFLVGFALGTWLYRFFLFLGIALLVYHFFFKLLGLFLFAVEIGWFIALPVVRECRVWWQRRNEAGSRVRWSVLVVAGLLLLALLPLPYSVRVPAVLSAQVQQASYAPRPAQVEAIEVRRGQAVPAGAVLLRLSAPDIDRQLDNARQRARLLTERLARRSADSSDLSDSLVLVRELQLERDRIGGLARERERLVVRAPLAGTVMQMADELHVGRWVDATTPLVLVGRPAQLEARGYLDGNDIRRIRGGQAGTFVDEQHRLPALDLTVQRIGAAAVERIDQWMLASVHGGALASRAGTGVSAHPEQAVFEVAAAVAQAPASLPMTELRGEIRLRGEPQSLAARAAGRVVQVFMRESGV